MKNLEELIRNKIPFNYKKAQTGFEPVICASCSDWNVRGGFKFENNSVGYNCFNCGADGRFEEGSTKISKRFRKILNSFQISDEEIDEVLSKNFIANGGLKHIINQEKEITLETLNKSKLSFSTPEVKLPKNSIAINKSGQFRNKHEELAVKYLSNRHVLNVQHDFFISAEKEYSNRVIIPFYRNGKIIYWQARSIDGSEPRYLNNPIHKTAVLYNYDELNRFSNLPLFVTEGVFDAIPINGVAIIGSTLNEVKIELLKKVKRRIIFVIQRDKNGKQLALEALENGWEISFPPEGFNDVNKAICETGVLWTINTIMKNAMKNSVEAQMSIKLNCPNKRK